MRLQIEAYVEPFLFIAERTALEPLAFSDVISTKSKLHCQNTYKGSISLAYGTAALNHLNLKYYRPNLKSAS